MLVTVVAAHAGSILSCPVNQGMPERGSELCRLLGTVPQAAPVYGPYARAWLLACNVTSSSKIVSNSGRKLPALQTPPTKALALNATNNRNLSDPGVSLNHPNHQSCTSSRDAGPSEASFCRLTGVD